jgi:hypothetical protein
LNLAKDFYKKIIIIYIISLIYAIVRYNVFGNVPWNDVPIFITNKAVALTVMILLLFSHYQKENVLVVRKRLLKVIFALTSWHVFISFVLLSPHYYGKFYYNDVLSITGYAVVTFGIVAYTGILSLNSENLLKNRIANFTISESYKKIIRKLIPIFIAGHLLFMGAKGWITPEKWYGYLFPISLISFILLLIYILKMWKFRKL